MSGRGGVIIAATCVLAVAAAVPVGAEQYLVLKNGVEHLGRAGEKDRFITCRGAVLSMKDATLRPTKDKCPSVRPKIPEGAPKAPVPTR